MRIGSLVLVMVLATALDAGAATFVVNTTADTSDNLCDAADCSLKDAVFEAQATPQFDVIELQPGALYPVTVAYSPVFGPTAYLNVTTPIRINGHGATIERPSSAPDSRFFAVLQGGALSLSDLTLANGGYSTINYFGGAIFSREGALTIDNCVFRDNHVVNTAVGGAIFIRDADLQVTRSSFINNLGEGGGGALYVQGTPTIAITAVIDRCSFVGNKALHPTSGTGGALDLHGEQTASITNSTFVGNRSSVHGGGVYMNTIPTTYTVDLVNDTIVGNWSGQGGGIYPSTCTSQTCPVANHPRLTNTILSNNFATQSNPNCANFFDSIGHNIYGTTSSLITGPVNPPDYPVSSLPGLTGLKDTGDAGGMHVRPSASALPVDNAFAAACSAGDQLELPRHGPVCDIGAIEYRPCVPPPVELTGWWPFDEYSGATAYEIAGATTTPATYLNTPASTPKAMVGRAHCFNGVNQSAVVPHHATFDVFGDCSLGGGEPLTIDVWLKTFAPGIQSIVDKRESAPNFLRGYQLYLQDGTLGFQMATGPGNAICGSPGSACTDFLAPPPVLGGAVLNDNRWHHVAVVVDRCMGLGEMYVDGALEHTFTPLTGNLANTANLLIANAYPVPVARPPFNGCLDELEIFKRALSGGEVAALHHAGWAGKCKPSTGHGGVGTPVDTVSGCVASLFGGLGQVVAAQGNVVRGCVKGASAAEPGTVGAGACLKSDPQGRVAKAVAKTTLIEPKKCEGVVTELGPESASAASAAAIAEVLDLTAEIFGTDLDATLARRSDDPLAAKCQAAVLAGAHKLVAAELKVFRRCAAHRFKDGTAEPATLASCAADTGDPDSIAAAAQPGGKIAGLAAKLAATAAKQCGGGDVAARFPGACATMEPATLGACVETRAECRMCRLLVWGGHLGVDCDAFDDGVANASCG